MQTLSVILAPENLTGFCIYFLSALTSAVFLKFIFCGDSNDRSLQKIVGGLLVFIIALVAQETTVFIAALLIGGLIIASEDFMKFLAAVLKTSSDKIPDTVSAFKSGKATPEEVQQKLLNEEVEEKAITEVHAPEKVPTKEHKEDFRDRLKKIAAVENLVHQFLQGRFGRAYAREVKIATKDGVLIVDGIVGGETAPKFFIEIKYITAKSFSSIHFQMSRAIRWVKESGLATPLKMVLVSEDMNLDIAEKIAQLNPFWSNNYVFLKLKDGVIEAIKLPEDFS